MVYSNPCCRCSFEPEIIKIGQLSHQMYSNNKLNFQESTPILNACTKKSGNLLNALHKLIWNMWYIIVYYIRDVGIIIMEVKVKNKYPVQISENILITI